MHTPTNGKALRACDSKGLHNCTTHTVIVSQDDATGKPFDTLAERAGLKGHTLALIPGTSGPRIDSRLLAKQLHNQHKAVVALLDRYADKLQVFGHLPFKKEVGERRQGGGKAERYAMLNEDQAFFLLSLSRNSSRVVELKARLITAFGEARRAAEIRLIEYTPAYHQLHDSIKQAANGSPNERFMHMNANKELNRMAGVEAGQRPTASPLQQSLLAVGSAMAARALQCAAPGKVHDRIKAALQPLAGLLALPGTEVTP
jgi:phage regulator Rha-like protein